MFLDQLELNAAVTVTRAIDIELTVFGDQGLAVTIVAAEVIKVLLCFRPPGGCKGQGLYFFFILLAYLLVLITGIMISRCTI